MKIKPEFLILIFFLSIFLFGVYKVDQTNKQNEANREFQRTIETAKFDCQNKNIDSKTLNTLPEGYHDEYCMLYIKNLKIQLRKEFEEKGIIIDPNL